jgi:hypothetical protein
VSQVIKTDDRVWKSVPESPGSHMRKDADKETVAPGLDMKS